MVTWQTIAEVNCAAQSAAANISIATAALLPQNVPTAVAVTLRMKICPRYQRETDIFKLKTVANLSYADACKELRTSRNPPVPHLASQSTFPPSSKVGCGSYSCKTLFKFHSVSAWYWYPTGPVGVHRNGTN